MDSIWTFISNSGPSAFNYHERSFWIVWCPGAGEPKKRHATSEEARNEARRLAQENPGKEFIVLKADSSFAVNMVKAISFS